MVICRLFDFWAKQPVVQREESAITQSNHYLVDNALDVPNPYTLYSDLSGDYCYPTSQSRSRILLTGYVYRFIFSLILTEFRGTWLEIGRNSHQKRGSLYSRKLPFFPLCRS